MDGSTRIDGSTRLRAEYRTDIPRRTVQTVHRQLGFDLDRIRRCRSSPRWAGAARPPTSGCRRNTCRRSSDGKVGSHRIKCEWRRSRGVPDHHLAGDRLAARLTNDRASRWTRSLMSAPLPELRREHGEWRFASFRRSLATPSRAERERLAIRVDGRADPLTPALSPQGERPDALVTALQAPIRRGAWGKVPTGQAGALGAAPRPDPGGGRGGCAPTERKSEGGWVGQSRPARYPSRL